LTGHSAEGTRISVFSLSGALLYRARPRGSFAYDAPVVGSSAVLVRVERPDGSVVSERVVVGR
jgi:hypothetical protein